MNMENKKTHAKGFQDLEVYQKAVAIAQDIFRLLRNLVSAPCKISSVFPL
jgi:hypothetical protein